MTYAGTSLTFTLLEGQPMGPLTMRWREVLDWCAQSTRAGVPIRAQVTARPVRAGRSARVRAACRRVHRRAWSAVVIRLRVGPVAAGACLAAALAIAQIGSDAFAQAPATDLLDLPGEVRAFVDPGTVPIALEDADLNGDGRPDYLLVLERRSPGGATQPSGHRSLRILVRRADHRLVLAKRNDKIVLCADCGGVMGDPFAGVVTEGSSFTVQHYGGSSWRWERSARFNYSRRDNTWQLVRVEHASFHASEPDKRTAEVFVPPKHYGKIDITEFDPEDFLGKGPK